MCTPSNNASVDPLESIPQTTSRSVQLFSQSSRSWRADKQTDRQRDHGDHATLHCVSKNDTDVTHYNFSIHQAILVIFGRGVAERVCYRTVICYPTSPSPFPIYLAKLVGKGKFDPTQLRNRLTDFDKIRTSELSPGDQPPRKISFRYDDAEQGMGHSEWPMTQVTHWALDPCDPWPMGHRGRHPILNQLMIDKFTADTKRTETSICCFIVGLLQYWIDYWIVKQWRSARVNTNEMLFLNFLLV